MSKTQKQTITQSKQQKQFSKTEQKFTKDSNAFNNGKYKQQSKNTFKNNNKHQESLNKEEIIVQQDNMNEFIINPKQEDPDWLLSFDYNSICSQQFQYFIYSVQIHPSYYNHPKKQKKTQKLLYQSQFSNLIYCLPNFMYSIAFAKFLFINQIQQPQQNIIIQQNPHLQQLLQFLPIHWEQALEINNIWKFSQDSPQVLLIRAIIFYPKVILEISYQNYSKQSINFVKFEGYQKKSFDEILSHHFWKTISQNHNYHFLRLQGLRDFKGFNQLVKFYIQRFKFLWRNNDVMIWIKAALGFILNQIQTNKFNYQQYCEYLNNAQNTKFRIPFLLRVYENVYDDNLNILKEEMTEQNNKNKKKKKEKIKPGFIKRNPFMSFLHSLLPWTHSTPKDPQQKIDPDMPIIQSQDD